MISRSLVEMVKCRWREFKREPSAFAFVLLFPVIFMIVLGISFNSDAPQTKLIGLSDAFPKDGNLYQELVGDNSIKLSYGPDEKLQKLMIKGQISLQVSKSGSGEIAYTFDKNSPDGQLTQLYVDRIVQNSAGQTQLVRTSQKLIETVGSRYVDFLIPGLLAFSIMSTSMFGTGMVLVVNRRENLLKRYLTTPMKPFEYIMSHVIGRQLIMFIEFAIIISAGLLFFGFTVKGNFLSFLLLAILGTFQFTFLAMLLGAKTNNAGAYNGISNLMMLPMMFLCGIWYSKYNFPDWLQLVAEALPLTPLVDSLRAVSLEGAGLSDIGMQLSMITGYTLLFGFLSKRTFRWY